MFFDNFAAIGLARQRDLLIAALRRQPRRRDVYGPSRQYFDAPNGRSTVLDRLLYADLKTYLVELLMKQDQMSMAASIESRVPFLDHKLVEFAAALPPRLKLRGFTTKWILREAVRSILPPEILSRPKMGFPVPFGDLDARRVERRRARRAARLPQPSARHRRAGRRSSGCSRRTQSGAADGADAIWSLLNLELWYRTFIDGDGVQTLPALQASAATPQPIALQATA